MSLFSNCGEYLPGQEPPNTSSIPTGTNNVIIPSDRRRLIYRLPDDRRPPWELKYKCEDVEDIFCIPPFCGRPGIRRRCKPCDGNTGNPDPGDFGCDYNSFDECSEACVTLPAACTIPPVPYECIVTGIDDCAPGFSGTIIRKECSPCIPIGINSFTNCPIYSDSCVYDSEQNCTEFCLDVINCSAITTGGGVTGTTTPVNAPPKYACRTVQISPCPPAGPITGGQNVEVTVTGAITTRDCFPCRAVRDSSPGGYSYIAPSSYGNNIPFPFPNEPTACVDLSACRTNCLSSSNCGKVITEPGDPGTSEPEQLYTCMLVKEDQCPPDPGLNPQCIITGEVIERECLPCELNQNGAFQAPTEYNGTRFPELIGATLPPQTVTPCVALSSCQESCFNTTNCQPSCPPEPKWRCRVVEKEYCPQVGTAASKRLKKLVRECVQCPPPTTTNPLHPDCVFASEVSCQVNCTSEENECIGPNGSQQLPSENQETGAIVRYARQETQIPCDSPLVGIQQYIRSCEERICSPQDPECIAYGYPDRPTCDDGWTGTFQGLCLEPNSNVSISKLPQEGSLENGTGSIGFGDTLGEEEQNPTLRQTSVSDPISLLSKLLTGLGLIKKEKIIDTEIIASKKEVQVEKVGESTNTLHPAYNFANIASQVTNEIVFVSNDLFRDIFADSVAKEVRYVLVRNVENKAWDERPIQSLTDERIALSLNPLLLKSLNTIHYSDGEQIPLSSTLEVIRRHMLMGNLDDFDPQYFIGLSNRQSNDEFNVYLKSTDRALLEAAALTILKEKEVTITKSDKDAYNARRLSRQRRLNVDVNARTCIVRQDGTRCELPVENKGLSIGKSVGESTVDATINNGVGDGYYLYLNVDGECVPFNYETEEEFTRYPPQNVRYESLKIMGEDPDITIEVDSLSGSHEFTSGVDLTINYEPMFLKLDLDSVSSIAETGNLVDSTSATYTLVTDQSEINEHLDTYGFATTKVHLDYRDPMIKYIYDTSTIRYRQNDINFNQLEPDNITESNKSVNNAVISRTIPFSLVITPVRGSALNPFNGISKIDSIGDKVSRSITMMPTISQNDAGEFNSPLEEKVLFFETGQYKVGLKETPDSNAITYRFNPSASYLRNSFFNKSAEGYFGAPSSIGSLSSYGLSYMVKNSLDYINDTYGVSTVSWFDIYRRLPMTNFVQVMYDSDDSLLAQIANSYRNNIQISNIFIRQPEDTIRKVNYGGSKYIVSEDYGILPEDDRVVISVEERLNILNSPPPTE